MILKNKKGESPNEIKILKKMNNIKKEENGQSVKGTKCNVFFTSDL